MENWNWPCADNTVPATVSAHGRRSRVVNVVVAGGGSAGHIEPALALADAVRRLDPSVQVTALARWTQPLAGSQLSSVQGFASSQVAGSSTCVLPVVCVFDTTADRGGSGHQDEAAVSCTPKLQTV